VAAALRTPSDLEIDRTAWFGIADARRKILKGQMVFVDRLLESAMAVCRDDR
jgi:predicted NUDIX family NTP pyrophosphohydrolase